MKIILCILPLTGAALLASAGEPAKTTTPHASVALTDKNDAPSTPAGKPEAPDQAPSEGITHETAHPGAAAANALRLTGRTVLNSVNPFAPVEQAPAKPWLDGAAWTTAAEKAVAKPGPVETRHESQFGWVICTK
jgi:hypothetical protein